MPSHWLDIDQRLLLPRHLVEQVAAFRPRLPKVVVADLAEVAKPDVPRVPSDFRQYFVHQGNDSITATIFQEVGHHPCCWVRAVTTLSPRFARDVGSCQKGDGLVQRTPCASMDAFLAEIGLNHPEAPCNPAWNTAGFGKTKYE